MYDHTKQYRCTIIRGKSQSEMDNLLPIYAKIIDEICPCTQDDFKSKFNNLFQNFLPETESERIKKTLDNHRTEISGKLFGMYFAADGMVYESERTQKYLFDNDQPAFFKDICFKMQFPNGMQKIATVRERIDDKINIRPYSFIMELLKQAKKRSITITKKSLGYYVLNALDVLQGNATPNEVLDVIEQDIKAGIERIIVVKGKEPSYTYQHINEQINLLELANLIRITDDKQVVLNPFEEDTIDLFASKCGQEPDFNVYEYSLDDNDEKKEFQKNWDKYFSKLSELAGKFTTSLKALRYNPNEAEEASDERSGRRKYSNLTEFGDEGEAVVYEYEKQRVSNFNTRLANKVLSLGKTRGLGYDIQSVVAKDGDEAEFVKYIEVKSTKRLTCPDLNDPLWSDSLNITRNEYIAAKQHRGYYSIFRVFFTRDGISIFVIDDVAKKIDDGTIHITPITYRIDYSNTGVNELIPLKGESEYV